MAKFVLSFKGRNILSRHATQYGWLFGLHFDRTQSTGTYSVLEYLFTTFMLSLQPYVWRLWLEGFLSLDAHPLASDSMSLPAQQIIIFVSITLILSLCARFFLALLSVSLEHFFASTLTTVHAFMPSTTRTRRRICPCLHCPRNLNKTIAMETIPHLPMKARMVQARSAGSDCKAQTSHCYTRSSVPPNNIRMLRRCLFAPSSPLMTRCLHSMASIRFTIKPTCGSCSDWETGSNQVTHCMSASKQYLRNVEFVLKLTPPRIQCKSSQWMWTWPKLKRLRPMSRRLHGPLPLPRGALDEPHSKHSMMPRRIASDLSNYSPDRRCPPHSLRPMGSVRQYRDPRHVQLQDRLRRRRNGECTIDPLVYKQTEKA